MAVYKTQHWTSLPLYFYAVPSITRVVVVCV